jgi:HK97 family phage portal protein
MKLWPFTRKSLASPDPALEAILGITPTTSGIAISAYSALQVPVVANAIQLISEAVASLDVHVKFREGDAEVDVVDHPVLDLLRGDANDWTSGFELIRQIMIDALVSDAGGMAWVNRVNGRPVEIISYRQGVITFDANNDTLERVYRLGDRRIPARDVIHLMPPLYRAPLNLAREAIAIAVAMDRHAARLFTRGGRPSGVLSFAKGMAEDAVKKARAAWRQTHEGEDTGGQTAILYDGATFTPLAMTSTDSQFLENRRFQIEEIARAFNIPAPMVGDLSRATWSNSEQKGREFLSYTLEPWLRGLEGALNRSLFTDEERGRYVIRFDRDDLTRADLATRATVINSLIASKTLNPNEGRSWLGLPPRAGGDQFLNPNITTAPTGGETQA